MNNTDGKQLDADVFKCQLAKSLYLMEKNNGYSGIVPACAAETPQKQKEQSALSK